MDGRLLAVWILLLLESIELRAVYPFPNAKHANLLPSSDVRVGHGWATAQGAGYKGALAH